MASERLGQFWGTIYEGTGDLATAVSAVEVASQDAGMVCARRELSGGTVFLEAVQAAPWYRILLFALPQRAEWRIAASGDRLTVAADFRLARWYTGVVLAACGLAALAFLGDLVLETGRLEPLSTASKLGVLASLFGFFAIWYLLSALGGSRTEQLWQAVLAEVEATGGILQPPRRGASLRYAFTTIAFVAFVLVLAFSWVAMNPHWPRTRGFSLWYGSLIAALVTLLGIAGVMFFRRDFGLRFSPLANGLKSGLCIILYLAAMLPFLIADLMRFDAIRLGRLHERQSLLGTLPATDPAHARLAEGLVAYRLMGWLVIGGSAIFALFAVGLAAANVRQALDLRPMIDRLSRNRGRGVFREAVRGGFMLQVFRILFGIVAIVFSATILAGLALAALCALHAAAPTVGHRAIRFADSSALMASLVLERPPGDPAVTALVRAGWLLYGATSLALFSVSIGQLLKVRSVLRRRLRGSPPPPVEVDTLLQGLRIQAGLPPIRLVVTSSRRVTAQSYLFWGRERFVEISTGALSSLDAFELRALLAHECAHHLRGHCRADNLLTLLGRLSLLGDGFMRVLEDSFGYEREADETAVRELRAGRQALLHCLIKARHVNSLSEKEPFALGLQAIPSEPTQVASLERSWRRAWRLFLEHYCGRLDLHYWHPSYGDRIAFVRALEDPA